MNSLLRILQLYSWIENKINTIVKKTQETNLKTKQNNTENTQNTFKTH